MDATFPSRASQTVTWQSSHTSGLSNFAWQEWGIDNGTANSTTVVTPLLNHKVESLGTKVTVKAEAGQPQKQAMDAEDLRSYREAMMQGPLHALLGGDKRLAGVTASPPMRSGRVKR